MRTEIIYFARGFRAGIFWLLALFIFALLLAKNLHAQSTAAERAEVLAIANEHRFTALETKLDSVQQLLYLGLTGISTLLAEAGWRIIKKPKP
jgi:hypothetical protein